MADNKLANQAIVDVWDPVTHTLGTTTTAVLETGDIELGAVEIKNGADDTRAVVSTAAAALEASAGLVVHEPVLGLAADAAVTTDVTATISARFRGLVNTVVARLPVKGQAAMTASMPVVIASDQTTLPVTPAATEAHLGQVGGKIKQLVATFSRPGDATPYSINDAVNNSTSAPAAMQFATAGRVVGGDGYIVGAEVLHEIVSITPRIRLYFFNTSPTLNNDNVTYAPTYAVLKAAGFLGVVDLDPMTSAGASDASRAQNMNIRLPYYCTGASQIIYALAQTLDAFTPGNAKEFAVKVYFDQN